MGFFKKIGGFVKKATKQISFKNLVKVGAGFDPTGIVGGLSAQHEAKKEEQAQAQAQANYEAQVSASQKNPNIGEIMTGALGGAFTGAGTVLAGSTSAGVAGATLVETTTNAWFKRNWLKLVGGVLGAVTVIMIFVKVMRPQRKTSYRR